MEPAVHPRWLVLFAMTRAVAVVIAVSLLIAHRVTPYDALLGWVTLCYGVLTLLAAVHRPRLFRHPAAWGVDLTIALGLILASGDWRSPFYLLALTALAPPTTTLGFRPALGVGLAFTVAFFVVAVMTGLDMDSLRSTIRLETLATHLALPGVVTLGLAYAAEVLRRLERERGRSERLAVEAERRRIAWDLHDSAKQRLHAAHLVFSSLEPSETVELGLAQLRGATADMETSIAELVSPIGDRSLEAALSERADDLASRAGGTEIAVTGAAPALPSTTVIHAYRILSEAMANAAHHSGGACVRVWLEDAGGALVAYVEDDGCGLPETLRPGANGLRTMRSRAFAIGGRLEIEPGPEGRGTRVRLEVPPPRDGAPSA